MNKLESDLSHQALFHLNCLQVERLIREQDLKKWWVAEATGIHKTTLRRWLSGRIDKIKSANLARLAEVLNIAETEIASPIIVR